MLVNFVVICGLKTEQRMPLQESTEIHIKTNSWQERAHTYTLTSIKLSAISNFKSKIQYKSKIVKNKKDKSANKFTTSMLIA